MKNKYISYYELLGMIKDGNIPKRIYVKLPQLSYGVNYIAIYDNGDFSHYYAEEDDINYKSYLSECFLENDMFGRFIQVLDEEEFEDIYNFCWNENYLFSNRQTGMTKEDRRLLDSNFKDIHDTINQLIKNQKKIISKLGGKND